MSRSRSGNRRSAVPNFSDDDVDILITRLSRYMDTSHVTYPYHKQNIAKILNLNEKTISTYKLRLLTKLSVTNLVDLVNKAKTLEIV
jgi:FixJ family two-component response regulator